MSDRELIKQKKEALIEMTNGFADRYLDEDYKMLCRKLIDKMSRKRKVPFITTGAQRVTNTPSFR